MNDHRRELLECIWNAQDEAYDLMCEYDSLPHYYGENILYQAEGQIIDLIAIHPGITITVLGNILQKTPSACSQIVRKLREKGWVEQTRNKDNNRQYNLTLTEDGMQIYWDHIHFTQNCQDIAFGLLEDFSEEELEAHLKIQRRLIEAYQGDVQRSRSRLTKPRKPRIPPKREDQ